MALTRVANVNCVEMGQLTISEPLTQCRDSD